MAAADAYFVALYDYEATASTSVNLRRGETVIVNENGGNGWYHGEATSGMGWFPESYVQKQDPNQLVPLGWMQTPDESGRLYYVNLVNGVTSWNRPTQHAKEPAGAAAAAAATGAASTAAGGAAAGSAGLVKSTSVEFDEPVEAPPVEQEVTVVEIEGRQFAVDASGKITYMDNFWTDKDPTQSGFDILVLKHRNGKEVLKDVSEWMHERAMVEDRYAKDLQKLAKSPLGNQEEGTMKTAWNQVKFEIEGQGRLHLQMAQDLMEGVEKPLMGFKDQQKKKRKDFETTIAKDRKNMALKEDVAEKARKLYMQKMKEADVAESQLAKAEPGQVNRLNDIARTERKKAVQAGIDYKKAVDDYNVMRKQWEDDMNLACLDFQEAEEERLQELQTILNSYLDIAKKLRDQIHAHSEMVRSSVQAVSTEVDIDIFVKSKGTGTRKPPVVTFKQYGSK